MKGLIQETINIDGEYENHIPKDTTGDSSTACGYMLDCNFESEGVQFMEEKKGEVTCSACIAEYKKWKDIIKIIK